MSNLEIKPWASFCMSTYKRPLLLKQQLELILKQTFLNFEIVISDNDPEGSAENVINLIADSRLKYFPNMENLGMMKSFNKSIERSTAKYIIMITDDDPVEENFLSELYKVYKQNNTYGVYAGFLRNKTLPAEIEFIPKDKFAEEILDPGKTKKILWSI